jgi:uncharacterized protein (DUF2384 family)
MLTTEDKEDIRRIIAETLLLIANEGFTDLIFVNPKTGETRVVEGKSQAKPIVEVTARAMEVFGTREKALRWLNTPARSLGDRTPLSLLNTPVGVDQVQDTLGRAEHGVW